MPGPETLLASTTAFSGRVFDVRQDEVRLPDGTVTRRDIVVHPGSVVLVPLDGEALLLVRQYRHAAGRELLELPAGTREPGEDPEATARRELAEEVGVAAARWTKLAELLVSPGILTESMSFYLCEELTAAADGHAADEDEELEVLRLPWPEAVERARSGRFDDLKTVVGVLLAAAARSGASNST
jgi:ADP-ribose pyrophosphatase